MTRLADRLASLETPRAMPTFKPKEVKDPEPFTGIETDLKRFKNQLSLVLANVGRFTDIQHQLRYCFSLLKGDAYTIMEPYISPSRVAFPVIEAFLKEITHIFGDSDEKASAARELEKLKQGSRDFARYYPDFARLTAILNLTKETKMQTLESYVGRLKRMDKRLRRIRGQPKGPPIAPQNPWIPVMPTTATGTHPGPMDLSAARRTVSPEERGRRIAEGLCFYCAGSGHQARSCPIRPGQWPIRPPPISPGRITSISINDKEEVLSTNQGKGQT